MARYRKEKLNPDKVPFLWKALLAAELVVIGVLAGAAVFLIRGGRPEGLISRDDPVEVSVATQAAETAEPRQTAAVPTAAPGAATELPGHTPEPTAEPTPEPTPEPTELPRTDGPVFQQTVAIPSRGVSIPATVCMPQTGGVSCPVVVFAHGFGGDRDSGGGFASLAASLYENGIASVRIDFSGCGESSEPGTAYCLTEMRADVQSAVRYMIAEYNVDPSRVGMIGYSLGGRVALEAVADDGMELAAMLLIAPAASTADFIRLSGGQSAWERMKNEAQTQGSTALFDMRLGSAFFAEMDGRESPAQAAAELFRGRAAVVYAVNDSAVLPSVSQSVAQALNCETLVLEGGGHAYGMYGSGEQYLNAITALAVRIFGGQ